MRVVLVGPSCYISGMSDAPKDRRVHVPMSTEELERLDNWRAKEQIWSRSECDPAVDHRRPGPRRRKGEGGQAGPEAAEERPVNGRSPRLLPWRGRRRATRKCDIGRRPQRPQGSGQGAQSASERERKAATPLRYTTDEWRDYLSPSTLARKAGCDVDDLPAMVLKELTDNAADAGAEPTLTRSQDGGWIVTDNGPGIDPDDVQKLFSVNRPLWSQKNKRLPSRGGRSETVYACARAGLGH